MKKSTQLNYVNVGAQMANARKMSGKSVAQFADKLRISKNTLTNYEKNNTSIPFFVIKRCHEICGLPYEYFAEGKEFSDYDLLKAFFNLSPQNQRIIGQLIEILSKN